MKIIATVQLICMLIDVIIKSGALILLALTVRRVINDHYSGKRSVCKYCDKVASFESNREAVCFEHVSPAYKVLPEVRI